ncbi:MAG: metal ABC transporter permease, partial [Bacteroidales bacterium]|nr:metal ABC transporter permease [Bacteroidales bacterium]
GIQWLSKNQNVREDSAIGVFWSLGMALGIILIFLSPGYAPNLSEYLFGNILTISQTDIVLLAILSLVLILFFTFFYRSILNISFDKEFAKTRGVPVALFEYILIMLVAVTIVLSIRLVGIVLLISLLTVPQMTANVFTNNFSKIMVVSVIISFVGCIIGLLLSYTLNVPSGAFIIFVLISIYLMTKLGAYIFRVESNK